MSEKFAEVPARLLAAQLDLSSAAARVTENLGMAGVDGISANRFRRAVAPCLRHLQSRLARLEYRPWPLRVVEIEKKKSTGPQKRRLLLVPAVIDRVTQTAAASWLGARWNPEFDDSSFAYRPGMGVHDALRSLAALRDRKFCWVLDCDVRAFFDSIDHSLLITRLEEHLGAKSPMLDWLRAWITASVWDGADLTRLARGVPQGSPISPLLANYYLDAFDRRLRKADVAFIRYADDFLVLARSPFELSEHRKVVEEALASLHLSLAEEKTRLTSFAEGFRFLGAEIRAESILLPFEKKKIPMRQTYMAPVMPSGLLRAFRAGHLTASAPFVWKGAPQTSPPRAAQGKAALNRVSKMLGADTQAALRSLREAAL